MTQKFLFSYCPVAILYISKTNSEDEIYLIWNMYFY